jgi:hypothetical protein
MSHVSATELVERLDEGDKNYAEVLSEDSMSVETRKIQSRRIRLVRYGTANACRPEV